MALFNLDKFYTKSKNNLSFFESKYKISYKAYQLLKKFVVLKYIDQSKLDFAYPLKWKPKILKNLSPRALRTLYRLSDKFEKNSLGIISQNYEINEVKTTKKKNSHKAQNLLHKIENDLPRYQEIDSLIKKYKIK